MMQQPSHNTPTHHYASHPRHWREFDYVYPVISRRSGGLSIGINLNVDRVCNWDCVYCQVDRTGEPPRRDVDLDQLCDELDAMLTMATSGALWSEPDFAGVPVELRRLNDIAFSGDGEPTTYPRFDEACRRVADCKQRHALGEVKIIVLTNMTMVHKPAVQRGFEILDEHQGEIWAKLDAGTAEFYQQVDRTNIRFDRVLRNIRDAGRARPLVIQSLFMKLHGEPISEAAFDAYLQTLADLWHDGCGISLVQLHTVARRPAESYVAPLTDVQLDALAARLRQRLPALRCEVYYGVEG